MGHEHVATTELPGGGTRTAVSERTAFDLLSEYVAARRPEKPLWPAGAEFKWRGDSNDGPWTDPHEQE